MQTEQQGRKHQRSVEQLSIHTLSLARGYRKTGARPVFL